MATTISISEETRDKLKEFGLKGETYDDIINRLYESACREFLHNFLHEDKSEYTKLEDWKKELESKKDD